MTEQGKLVLAGAKVVTPERVFGGSVEVSGGKIGRVGGFDAPPGAEVIDCTGRYVLPGLIDMHLNDGRALLSGVSSPEEHADRLVELSRGLIGRGITGMFLATLAAPVEEIVAYLRGMERFRRQWEESPAGTELCGALVEGTFMNPANCGAQNPSFMFAPDRGVLDRLIEAGPVRMVNIAPEYGESALELIEYAAGRGLIPAAGHCKPTADMLRLAVDRGARYFIHFLNGPTGSSTKEFGGGGTLEGALRDDRLYVELIADYVHVARPVLRDVISRKTPARVVAVSDAMFPTDPPEGEFEIGGILGRINEQEGYIEVTGRRGARGEVERLNPPELQTCDVSVLYGAAVNQDVIFANMVGLMSSGMEGNWVRSHEAHPFDEAVRLASLMCTTNAAEITGLLGGGNGRRVGAVAPGCDADLLVAGIEPADGGVRFTPEKVFIRGERIS